MSLTQEGLISGTPSGAGTFSFTIGIVSDTLCLGQSRSYTLAVDCPSVTVLPDSLPLGESNVVYSVTLTGAGGNEPYTFAVTGGSLPVGMTLTPDGELTGAPLSGSSGFVVTATDDSGCEGSREYSLQVVLPDPSILTTNLATAVVGQTYSQALAATGGTPPYLFLVNGGALPSGINLSTAGELAGTPVTEGSYPFSVAVLDRDGNNGVRDFVMTVLPPGSDDWWGAAALGDGWQWLNWFGYFNTNPATWIFHLQHAWLYPFGTNPSSLVFWDNGMQAFWWTSPTVYPYVYRFSDGAWLYYLRNSNNPRWFYNYTTEAWEQQ